MAAASSDADDEAMSDPDSHPPEQAAFDLRTVRPGYGTPPDIGSPASRAVTLVAVVLLYLLIAVSQNLTTYLIPAEPQPGRMPRGGEFAKLMMLIEEAFRGMIPEGQLARTGLSQFAASSHPADQLQGVLLLGEAEGPESALDWLDLVRSNPDAETLQSAASGLISVAVRDVRFDPAWTRVKAPEPGAFADAEDPPDFGPPDEEGRVVDSEVVLDARAMETLYTDGLGALSAEQVDRLRDRYGWIGALATTPADSGERDEFFDDVPWAVAFFVFVFVMFIVWGFGGLAMLVLAIVMLAMRRLPVRFEKPAPGGSVFLETFVIFLFGFGMVQVVSEVLATQGVDPRTVGLVSMLGQWSLILTVFWPVVRGVPMSEWRGAVGWSAPRGVFREVLAGVAGYFAGVPLLFLGMVMTVVLTLLSAALFGEPDAPPTNPVLEMVRNADALTIVLLISLATVWAPIVEETLFRGSIYRHMRGRAPALLVALATALLFAFMHSYGPLMVGPLIALGFTFALIREWRGSLIGSITAHCLHNSTIMVLMLLAMKAMA